MNDSEFSLWRNKISQEFAIMGVNFYNTAKNLFKKMINERAPDFLDQLIFPCLYSYRHSLELVQKYILITKCNSKEEVITMLNSKRHNLLELFHDVNRINNFDEFELEVFEKVIDYINKIDPYSDYFRYPFGLYGDYNFESQIWIDYRKLYNAIEITDVYMKRIIANKQSAFDNISFEIDFVSDDQVPHSVFSTIGTGGLSRSFRYQMNGFNKAAEFLKDKNEYVTQKFYFERLSIELVLKDIIYYIMDDSAFKLFRKKTHSIIGLWNKVESILNELRDKDGATLELFDIVEISSLKELLEKIHEQDLSSDQ